MTVLPRITCLAAALVLAATGCSSGPPAGAMALSAADAEAVGLGAYRGDVLILDFWAVW